MCRVSSMTARRLTTLIYIYVTISSFLLDVFRWGGDLIRNIGPDMKVCKVDVLAIIRSI
jgi:hypothetical protein